MFNHEKFSHQIKKVLTSNLLDDNDTSFIFYDFDILKNRLKSLQKHFPANATHAIAIKSNPIVGILKFIRKKGFSVEAASMGEIKIALEAGFKPQQIVFDSPVKTKNEISHIYRELPGLRVNADSIAELNRYKKDDYSIKLGLRINPEQESKTISYLDVSGTYSKFGEPISNREEIVEAIQKYPSVDCLHIHQGSQIGDLTSTAQNIQKVIKLAHEVNNKTKTQQIKFIDIGGGMPVNYKGAKWYDISSYTDILKEECPGLFDGSFTIITEFGRYIHTHAGYIASRVEYIKHRKERDIILCHTGANIFVRECYNPGHWPHKVHAFDGDGRIKNDIRTKKYDIAGPLCFSGDFPARDIALPKVDAGDWLIFRDCGANTFALWSRHCSRKFPKILSITNKIGLSTLEKQHFYYTLF